ncbi:hypothetical protein T05_11468 [Trichinella murrelli]|uniref:Uncharacterized protein n=1 Tax=Trichinella murrelli TaxID=144512 RepID=A0A0V0TQG8_9BILA|nr:hypothetical protein T05_11468 [Trichinella murrelli]
MNRNSVSNASFCASNFDIQNVRSLSWRLLITDHCHVRTAEMIMLRTYSKSEIHWDKECLYKGRHCIFVADSLVYVME